MPVRRSSVWAMGCATFAFAASCAPPPDPWVGRWDGTLTTAARECTDGTSRGERVTDLRLDLMRTADGRLFFADLCPIFLDDLTASYAIVEPTSCDITNAAGTPVHVEIVGGSVTRTGDTITGNHSARATSPTECLTIRSDYEAMQM